MADPIDKLEVLLDLDLGPLEDKLEEAVDKVDRLDGKTIRVLKRRHDTDISEILAAARELSVQAASVQKEIVAEELQDVPEEQRAEILEQIDAFADREFDTVDLPEMYGIIGRLLWAGAVRFEPSLEEEDVAGLVGRDNVGDLPIGTMMEQAFPEQDDDTAGKAPPTTETS